MLRVYLCNPRGFAREYPHEVLAFQDGQTQHFTKWYGMDQIPPAERGYSSFASAVWRQNTAEALRRYVEHVRQADYARHVIGFFLCGGGTEEWYYYENYDETRYCLDSSPAMKAAFRSYLRTKYGGDVARLRSAWQDTTVTFETAEPPGIESRFTADAGVFWDPAKSQSVRDYYYVQTRSWRTPSSTLPTSSRRHPIASRSSACSMGF